MNRKLRDAWRNLVRAEDYDAHMAAIGQAQANASLVAEYFVALPPPGAEVLFLGAGTGQMFDFVSPSFLAHYRTTFADINFAFLDRLRQRLSGFKEIRYTTVEDDIEQSALKPGFDLIVAVLLLEHVDWRKAVATMCRLAVGRILVVTQENPQQLASAMTPSREVPGTMKVLRELHPELIPRQALRKEFRSAGFTLAYETEKIVADEKKMIASGFAKLGRIPGS
jgi:ubiquinone/menaquinone biosynthesis C-methylase UbiE